MFQKWVQKINYNLSIFANNNNNNKIYTNNKLKIKKEIVLVS